MSSQNHAKFLNFHYANPHVYNRLRALALEMKRQGIDKYSMKGLFEVLRWEHALKTTGDVFKLNNNYTSLYARGLMQNEPQLEGFFALRKAARY